MSENRLTDRVKERGIATQPEGLEAFEGKEMTLRSYNFATGNYSEYVIMDVVDGDGVAHLLTTGGVTVLRILHQLDPETDLPAQVKFVKVTSGTGRKVWGIE